MKEMVTMEKLQAFFIEHPRVALAFSGGADSAYVMDEYAEDLEKRKLLI